jgi:hypothetical protein
MKAFNKALTTTAVFALTFAISAAPASAGDLTFSALDNSKASQLCLAAVQGNRPAMKHEIDMSKWSKQFVINNIQCNSMSIGSFVAKYSSESMQRLIPLGTQVRVTDLAQNSSFSGQVTVSK